MRAVTVPYFGAADMTVDQVRLPLDRAAEADRRLEAGGLTDRIALTP